MPIRLKVNWRRILVVFAVFEITHKRGIKFAVGIFFLWVCEETLFSKSFGLRRCDCNVYLFSMMLLDSATLIHVMNKLFQLGHFNFCSEFSTFLALNIVKLSFNCFALWLWTRPVMREKFSWVRSSRFIFSDVSLLNHGFSEYRLVLYIVKLTFKFCLSQFCDSLGVFFRPTLNVEGKSSTQNAEIEPFSNSQCQTSC